MNILFIDASAEYRRAAPIIEKIGARVTHARSLTEALAVFTQHQPDLIFLDDQFPDTLAAAREIREKTRGDNWVPIIFLVSPGREQGIERAIDQGCDDFLSKPVSPGMLRTKIRCMQRFIQMHASMLALSRHLENSNKVLQHISACDGLTGIPNRRHFDSTLNQEWRRMRRQAGPLTLLMCDVNYFKRYNDSLGHPAGDECLRRVAALLAMHAERASDTVARYGGEEFAMILPETDLAGAQTVAEKICSQLVGQASPHPDSPFGIVTMSIGIAVAIPQGDSPAMILGAADQALYQAKNAGRNCIRSINLG